MTSPDPRSIWTTLRERAAREPMPDPTGVTVATYLDIAERIVRAAVPWQDRFGAIVDPYRHFQSSTLTPRFVGALGQLIGAGRCADLLDVCARSYEQVLSTITDPRTVPEFSLKELVLAHEALRTRVARERVERWEAHWRDYRLECAASCVHRNLDNNFNTFALVGEFARIQAGLGGDMAFVERLIEKEMRHIDENGMYEDPGGPLTYHVVVMQQWALLLMLGYRGRYHAAVRDAVRRGGLASLLMQSVTGQAPFGGRSNQFHHMEAQSAALFEVCARLARDDGDALLAGAFKRAARRDVALIRPWIMEMEPYRHLKQGFHPSLDHGNDAPGLYSVYGTLPASLLGMAVRTADETIGERLTPAELGGYVFCTTPRFHQVFAHCGGWTIQVDTKANLEKDATGLGRVQRVGLRPETILAGSIPARPNYSFAFPLPQRNVAIGPEWGAGQVCRLADFSAEIREVRVSRREESPEHVAFEIEYAGDLGGLRSVREHYDLTPAGLRYRAETDPATRALRYTVPIIETDGDARSEVESDGHAIRVLYRGGSFSVTVENGSISLTDERDANRNALYRVALATSSAGAMALRISSP